MKNLIRDYFTFYLKPVLMITCFISNLTYLITTKYYDPIIEIAFIIAFSIKPIFFLVIFGIFICKLEEKSFTEVVFSFLIVFLIFFGFPVKEISEFTKSNGLKKFFDGKEYFIDEYMFNHFIITLLIETVPITSVIIYNNSLMNHWKETDYFPVACSLSFLIIYFFALTIIFNRKDTS